MVSPIASTGASPDGRFRLGEVVEEARELVAGTKGVFFAMALIALAVLGTIVTVLFDLALLFVLDRDAGVAAALAGAWRILTANVAGFLLFALLAVVLLLAGTLTLGIGFLWIVPFLNIAIALVYAHAVGIESL